MNNTKKSNSENKILELTLERIGLSNRTIICLKKKKINNVKEILDFGIKNLLSIKNLGKNSFKEILNLFQLMSGFDNKTLNIDIDYLFSKGLISVRTNNLLRKIGIYNAKDIFSYGLSKLMYQRGFGKKSFMEIIKIFNYPDYIKAIKLPEVLKKSACNKRVRDSIRTELFEEEYLKLGTLQKVADKHNLTRERVRQILKRGQDLGIIKRIDKNKRYKDKLKDISINQLLDDLKEYLNLEKLSIRYDIPIRLLKSKIKKSGIKIEDIILEGKKNRLNLEYLNLVNKLGHHVSTTEMDKNFESRALHMRIIRMWGTINIFRSEYGYPIIKSGNPNIVEDVLVGKKINHSNMIKNLDDISEFIKCNQYCKAKTIYNSLNINRSTLSVYLSFLLKNKKIVRIKKGNTYIYRISDDI